MNGWQLGHRPGLDGLRGIAILLVLVAHLGFADSGRFGQPGVTAFFVLSGFLITALLLEERVETGDISLSRFWIRRARRLLPALVACVALTVTFAYAVGLTITREWLWAMTYVMNFVQAGRESYVGGLFGHTWSLAIEEQFYLAWPLILLACRRWRPSRLLALTLGAAVVSAAVRYALVAGGAESTRTTYGTDVRAEALLLGCALAIVFVNWRLPEAPRWLVPAGLAGLSVSTFAFSAVSLTVAALATTAVIAGIVGRTPTGRLLSSRVLVWFGQRSYGLYLWHVPVLVLVGTAWPEGQWWERALVAYPIAAVLVVVSWRYVEQPFLRRPAKTTDRELVPAT